MVSAPASWRTRCCVASTASATRSICAARTRRQRSDRQARTGVLASALARRALGRSLGRRGNCAAARHEQHRSAGHPAPVRNSARATRGDARARPASRLTMCRSFRTRSVSRGMPAAWRNSPSWERIARDSSSCRIRPRLLSLVMPACRPVRASSTSAPRLAASRWSCRAMHRCVLAADRSIPRLARLRENVRRLDARNIVLLQADATQPPVRNADAVSLDAPCSGTGAFRRHPDARWRLKAARHSRLERDAAGVSCGGGRKSLGRAACSSTPRARSSRKRTIRRSSLSSPSIRSSAWSRRREGVVPDAVMDAGRLRVLPQRHGVDGAFAARLRRVGGRTA